MCPDYDEQSSHTSIIREHYVFLLETLDVKFSGIVNELYSKEVVSAVERDDICAEKTSFRANEKLLSVLSRKSPQQFQLFLNALDNCGQRHVRNVIADRRPGLDSHIIIPTDVAACSLYGWRFGVVVAMAAIRSHSTTNTNMHAIWVKLECRSKFIGNKMCQNGRLVRP